MGNAEYWNGDIPWFSSKDIKSFDLESSQDHITKIAVTNSATRVVDAGTILLVGRSGILAHTLPIGIVRQPSAFNQDIRAIVPEPAFDSEFIAIYLKALQPIIIKDGVKRGPTVHSLEAGYIENVEIPVFPIDQQRRIAATLKAQLAEVETTRRAVKEQLRELSLLPSRIINDVFNEINGEPTTLDEILVEIQTGKSFQTAETLAGPDELGVLKVSAVTWTEFRPDEAKALRVVYDPAESHKVKNGDFIISRANTKEFVGAVVLVDRDYPNRLLSDKTLRLVVDERRVCKEFLIFALRTSMARRHIEHYATGTSDSMRNISQGTITSIPLRLPELNEQRRLATQLKTRLKEVTEIRSAIETQLQEIEKLPNRILAQAFES